MIAPPRLQLRLQAPDLASAAGPVRARLWIRAHETTSGQEVLWAYVDEAYHDGVPLERVPDRLRLNWRLPALAADATIELELERTPAPNRTLLPWTAHVADGDLMLDAATARTVIVQASAPTASARALHALPDLGVNEAVDLMRTSASNGILPRGRVFQTRLELADLAPLVRYCSTIVQPRVEQAPRLLNHILAASALFPTSVGERAPDGSLRSIGADLAMLDLAGSFHELAAVLLAATADVGSSSDELLIAPRRLSESGLAMAFQRLMHLARGATAGDVQQTPNAFVLSGEMSDGLLAHAEPAESESLTGDIVYACASLMVDRGAHAGGALSSALQVYRTDVLAAASALRGADAIDVVTVLAQSRRHKADASFVRLLGALIAQLREQRRAGASR